MLTFFAQAHVPITAFYLARVGVSAIQRAHTAPRTPDELFWMNDCTWSRPLGFARAVITIIRKRFRVSLIFFVFGFTCMVALVTPEMLSRAYPVGLVNVTAVDDTFTPFAFSPQVLHNVDQDTQIGLGLGSWATGLSIFNPYEFSVYSRDGMEDLNDFFFSGYIDDVNVRLPGLRLQGGCAPLSDDTTTDVEQDTTLFPMFCNNSLPLVGDQALDVKVSYGNANVTYSYCTYPSISTAFSGPDSDATAYIFLQTNNGTVETTGMVMCQSSFSLGSALLSGEEGTYASFQKNVTPDAPVHIADPLSAVLAGISNGSVVNHTFESGSILVKQLGYNVTFVDGNRVNLSQPSLENIAEQIWLGVAHMTAGIGLLSSVSNISYPVAYPMSGRIRSNGFVIGAYTLLALWLCGLIYVSIRGYRPSTDSGLGSRVAVRVYEKRFLGENRSQPSEFSDGGRTASGLAV
ncbi:hypothetical protein BU17DRAFT_38194 [Hysterangium stoloniferum]|nr:hypothetical protein BU17DRAFT_38194 [Hysterangium stoloniferum]